MTTTTAGGVMRDRPLDPALLAAGDPRAVEALYQAHARTVLGWVIRLGGPDLVPEEVAQDVFEVALGRLRTFRADGRPEAWLWGITRRVVANARRRARLRRFFGLTDARPPASPEPGPDETYARRRRVQEMLAPLPTAQREAVVLVDLEGRSAVEAAELLGVPVGTVYSRLHAARRALGAQHAIDTAQDTLAAKVQR